MICDDCGGDNVRCQGDPGETVSAHCPDCDGVWLEILPEYEPYPFCDPDFPGWAENH